MDHFEVFATTITYLAGSCLMTYCGWAGGERKYELTLGQTIVGVLFGPIIAAARAATRGTRKVLAWQILPGDRKVKDHTDYKDLYLREYGANRENDRARRRAEDREERTKGERDRLSSQCSYVEQQLSHKNGQLDEVRRERVAASLEAAGGRDRARTLTAEVSVAQANLRSTQETLRDREDTIHALERQLEEARQEESSALRQLGDARACHAEAETARAQLGEENAALRKERDKAHKDKKELVDFYIAMLGSELRKAMASTPSGKNKLDAAVEDVLARMDEHNIKRDPWGSTKKPTYDEISKGHKPYPSKEKLTSMYNNMLDDDPI